MFYNFSSKNHKLSDTKCLLILTTPSDEKFAHLKTRTAYFGDRYMRSSTWIFPAMLEKLVSATTCIKWYPDSKIHGVNMGPRFGPTNLATRGYAASYPRVRMKTNHPQKLFWYMASSGFVSYIDTYRLWSLLVIYSINHIVYGLNGNMSLLVLTEFSSTILATTTWICNKYHKKQWNIITHKHHNFSSGLAEIHYILWKVMNMVTYLHPNISWTLFTYPPSAAYMRQ